MKGAEQVVPAKAFYASSVARFCYLQKCIFEKQNINRLS